MFYIFKALKIAHRGSEIVHYSQPAWYTRCIKKLSLLKIVTLIFLVTILAFFITSKLFNISPPYIKPTKKTVTTVSSDKIKIYENPTLHYTFQYPLDWEGGGITRPIKIPTEEEYFQINSPDYKILDTEDGIFYIDKGSQILVDAESTSETSVNNLLNNNFRRKELARDITNAVVDGQQGLQYEYTDQKIHGTTTMFIKNGIAYFVTFEYVDQDERKYRWDIYKNLINTFKAR